MLFTYNLMNLSYYAGYEQSFRTKFRIYHQVNKKKIKRTYQFRLFLNHFNERGRRIWWELSNFIFPIAPPFTHTRTHTIWRSGSVPLLFCFCFYSISFFFMSDANKGWKKNKSNLFTYTMYQLKMQNNFASFSDWIKSIIKWWV